LVSLIIKEGRDFLWQHKI